MNGARRLINDLEVRCAKCGPSLVPCFAGIHEGTPVMGRYYCQRHSVQVIVLGDGVVIEIPNPQQAAATRRADVRERLGSAVGRLRTAVSRAVGGPGRRDRAQRGFCRR